MRRAIFSAKVEHPLIVSFVCENCGESNSFTQNISVKSNKNISLSSQNKKIQTDDLNTESASQDILDRKIEKLLQKAANDRFSWINAKKCTNCGYYQSWQKKRLWTEFIESIGLWLILMILGRLILGGKIIGSWLYLTILVLGIIVVLPIFKLVIALNKIDPRNKYKPTIGVQG